MKAPESCCEDVSIVCRRVRDSLSAFQPAISDLRFLRNSSANVEQAVQIMNSGVICDFFRFSRNIVEGKKKSLTSDSHQIFDSCHFSAAVTVICQIIANVASRKGEMASNVWLDASSEGFQDLIEASMQVNRRDSHGAAIAALFNCVAGSDDASLFRFQQFLHNRKLISHLFLSIPNMHNLQTTAGLEKSDPVREWVHLLVYVVVQRASLVPMFVNIAPRSQLECVWAEPAPILDFLTGMSTPSHLSGLSTEITHEQVLKYYKVQHEFVVT